MLAQFLRPIEMTSSRLSFSRFSVLLLCLFFFFSTSLPSAFAEEKITTQFLLKKIDQMYRGLSSKAIATMTVKTRRYTRTMKFESWSKGSDKSLIRILLPKKDKGVSTLKVGKNIWNYLPKIDRVTKIPSSMMMGSWMGSHFTNDDLVRESSFEDDYTSTITFEGTREGQAVYEITSVARPEAAVVWGSVVMVVEKKRLIPIKATYLDEEGEKIREMLFKNPEKLGKRWVPTLMVLKPLDKPEERTTMEYNRLEFDIPLSPGMFSLRGLRDQ